MTREAVGIAVLAAVTYVTRAGGLLLFERRDPHPDLIRLLNLLAYAILAALLTSVLLKGDIALLSGTAAAALVMAVVRRPLAAMLVALIVTCSWRALM